MHLLAVGLQFQRLHIPGAPHAPYACQTELLWFVRAQSTCPVPGAWPFLVSRKVLSPGDLCPHPPEVAGGGAVAAEHWIFTQKVAGSGLTRAGSWKTPPVHPASSGYLTLVGEGTVRQRRERDGLRSSYAVP